MKNNNQKVYYAEDRLYLKTRYDGKYLLIDKRENIYECSDTIEGIIQHIDDFVKEGKYYIK